MRSERGGGEDWISPSTSSGAGPFDRLRAGSSGMAGMCSVGRGHVFSFSPNVFSFQADVFSLAGDVFSFRRHASPLAAPSAGSGQIRRGRRDDGDVSTRSGPCVQFRSECVHFRGPMCPVFGLMCPVSRAMCPLWRGRCPVFGGGQRQWLVVSGQWLVKSEDGTGQW